MKIYCKISHEIKHEIHVEKPMKNNFETETNGVKNLITSQTKATKSNYIKNGP
jgi:hypothetical protein